MHRLGIDIKGNQEGLDGVCYGLLNIYIGGVTKRPSGGGAGYLLEARRG